MAVLSVKMQARKESVGRRLKKLIFIETNDTLDEITSIGYLNNIEKEYNLELLDGDVALVTMKNKENQCETGKIFFKIRYAMGNFQLEEQECKQ